MVLSKTFEATVEVAKRADIVTKEKNIDGRQRSQEQKKRFRPNNSLGDRLTYRPPKRPGFPRPAAITQRPEQFAQRTGPQFIGMMGALQVW